MSSPRRFRLGLAATVAATAVALAATAPSRADEVVLDNGRTLVGRVVSDDGTTIRLEMETGTMKIDRSHVREVRKGALPAKRADPAPADTGGTKPSGGTPPAGAKDARSAAAAAPRVAQEPSDSAPHPQAIADKLTELERTEKDLRPWPTLESSGTDDPPRTPWRIQSSDGQIRLQAEAPAPGSVSGQVWTLRTQTAGGRTFLRNGAIAMEWVPVYAYPGRGDWYMTPPQLKAFQRFDAISESVIRKVLDKDVNVLVACGAASQAMSRKQGGSRVRNASVSIEDELATIRTEAAKVAGTAAAADIARCFEIEHLMNWESAEGRIRLARERLPLLRRVVAALPAEPAKPSKR